MGTRNLTVVIHKNKIKLSQYGQWDGYFSCTGVKFLEFVKDNLQGKSHRTGKKTKELRQYQKEWFVEKLDCLEDVDEETLKKYDEIADEIGTRNGDIKNTSKYAIPYKLLFPTLHRDTGVEILNIINGLQHSDFKYYEAKDKRKPYHYEKNCKEVFQKLPVQIDLDSSWCEFINIIDLDNDEIYMLTNHEFNTEPLKTNKLVEEVYKMPCWYKSKIADIPTIKNIEKYKNSIGLDYWQREETGEWVSH